MRLRVPLHCEEECKPGDGGAAGAGSACGRSAVVRRAGSVPCKACKSTAGGAASRGIQVQRKRGMHVEAGNACGRGECVRKGECVRQESWMSCDIRRVGSVPRGARTLTAAAARACASTPAAAPWRVHAVGSQCSGRGACVTNRVRHVSQWRERVAQFSRTICMVSNRVRRVGSVPQGARTSTAVEARARASWPRAASRCTPGCS